MTIYGVYSRMGALVAYFLNQIDAYMFIQSSHIYGHVETLTVAANFFTSGGTGGFTDSGAGTPPA